MGRVTGGLHRTAVLGGEGARDYAAAVLNGVLILCCAAQVSHAVFSKSVPVAVLTCVPVLCHAVPCCALQVAAGPARCRVGLHMQSGHDSTTAGAVHHWEGSAHGSSG